MSYYKIHDLENYFKMYKKSVREPRKFWDRIADENFIWYQKWDKVFEVDMQEANFKWFLNAKLNITKNCIDRHLAKEVLKPLLFLNQIIQMKKLYTFRIMNCMKEFLKWPMF